MSTLASKFTKIVFHFDGNNNDPDDIAALPIAAMLANSGDIENKTTFFYNNNLSENNNSSRVEKMRNSAAFAEKLGVATVDYQQNINAATDKLVNIFNSGEKILSIEGGPMEAVYRALAKTSASNRQNITLISHSGWNENRDVINRPGITEARTWSDLKQDFPEVNFIDIDDQNPGFYNDDWNWLDKTNNPIFNEARDLMIDSNKRNDPSDAGMLFYALTGQENANPKDAKDFLEDNLTEWSVRPPSNPSPSPQPPSNPLVIEAEDLALTGKYRVESNQFASGGEVISLRGGDNDDSGAASFEFNGATGKYDVKVTYFDENDGVGQITIKQDSLTLKSFQLDRQLGSSIADEKTRTTVEIDDVDISNGDQFTIEGIEQGSKRTAEHTRIDRVEFIPTETSNSPPTTEQDIELEFDATKQWNYRFDSNISFTNNGEQFQGWEVEFKANFEIDKIWNAEIVSQHSDRYLIKDVSSNDNVYAGETTTFGFTADTNGKNIEPSNFVFNGQEIDVEVDEIKEPPPSSPTPTPTPTPSPTPSPSNKAISVGFEQHNNGTKYNQSAQSRDWDVNWVNKGQMDNYAVITDDEVHSGDKALKITYRPDARTGGSAAWKLPSEKEYYLSYWVKFEDNFDFDGDKHSGGKLPGLAGAGGYCSGGETCNGNNGFSSRYMWRENGRAQLYLYHMDKPGKFGEEFWFKDRDGDDVYFERGKWHNLIQRVRINDGNQSNGEVDVWMNGEQVLSVDDLKFVTNNQGIDALMFSTFHGGGKSTEWWPDYEVHSYFDDFVVSTEASDVGV